MSDEIDLDDEDDAILAAVWDRVGDGKPARSDSELSPELSRRMLALALGAEAADAIEYAPETRAEFDAMMVRVGGGATFDAIMYVAARARNEGMK